MAQGDSTLHLCHVFSEINGLVCQIVGSHQKILIINTAVVSKPDRDKNCFYAEWKEMEFNDILFYKQYEAFKEFIILIDFVKVIKQSHEFVN